jgi:tetratricopeptide (TPR) repeat protein
MKLERVLLVIIAANLLGLGALLAIRHWSLSPTPETDAHTTHVTHRHPSAGQQPGGTPAAAAHPALSLPTRPELTLPENATPAQVEVHKLRLAAFDEAEFLVTRLNGHPQALCLLGKLHLRHGNVDAARNLWDAALARDSRCDEAYIDYGHLELKQGNFAEAEQHFQQALRINPERGDAYLPLAEALLSQSKAPEAAAKLNTFLQRAPRSVVAWNQLGKAQMQAGQLDEALHSYSQALSLDSASREALYGLLTTHRARGDQDDAKRMAEKLAALDAATPRVSSDRNVVDLDIVKLRDLLTFTIQSGVQLLAQTGDGVTAVQRLEKGLETMPEEDELRMQLADLYAQSRNYTAAAKILKSRCQLAPEDASRWMDLAMLSLKFRQLDAADQALRKVIELRPQSDTAHALLAQTQMPPDRNPTAAVTTAQRAVELRDNAGNRYILATALYHAGDAAGCKRELEAAIKLDPTHADARNALANLQTPSL